MDDDVDISIRGQFVVVRCSFDKVKSVESAIVLQHGNITSSVLTRYGIFNLVPVKNSECKQDE